MKRIAIGLLVVLLVAGAGIAFSLDALVERAIERGSEYALGVDTEVGSVRLGVLGGRFGLKGLRVSNPAGFDSPHFLSLREVRTGIDLRTLRSPVVEMPELVLSGIDLHIERRLDRGTNYGKLLDHLEKTTGSGEKPAAEGPPAEDGKRFVIRELALRDVTAHLHLAPELGTLPATEIALPEVKLRGVGSGGAGGISLAQLSELVVRTVLASAARQGTKLGPLAEGLQGRVEALPHELIGSVEGLAEEGSERLEKRGGDVLRGARDLLRGGGSE